MIELPYAGLDEAVREIVSRIVLQVEDEHARHLTEELRLQSRQLDAYASRIAELEALLSDVNTGYAECIATREDYRARIAALEAAFGKAANDMQPMLRSMISRGEAAEIVRRAARAAMESECSSSEKS